ncbi:unnamed protein product [Sphagnum jensenii]
MGSRAQDPETGGIDEVDFVKPRYPQKNFADTYACLPCVATVIPNASSFDLFLSARLLQPLRVYALLDPHVKASFAPAMQ